MGCPTALTPEPYNPAGEKQKGTPEVASEHTHRQAPTTDTEQPDEPATDLLAGKTKRGERNFTL